MTNCWRYDHIINAITISTGPMMLATAALYIYMIICSLNT